MSRILIVSFLIFLSTSFCAQNKPVHKGSDLQGFDKEAAWKQAQKASTKPATQKEYFQFLMRKYAAAKKNTSAVINATVPYSANYNAASKTTTINLNPANANCNDFGFETMNFNNWTGDTWTLSGLDWTTAPIWTGGIVTMGTNITPQALATGFTANNRMTILTIPPTVNNPPANCIGWDSIAVNPLGHLSGIPFVPPTGSGVTCRLGNANTGSETERLRYSLAVSSANSQITVSYAVVLQNPGHPVNTQPFFQINMYDQNGNPIAGCGNYQVDATMAVTDPTFVSASRWDAFGGTWTDPGSPSYYDSLFYKPWTQVGVDLTAYIGTTVTLEFRTGDCAYGGHFGYAYVDASCSPSQIQVNMCPGYPNQDAIAPPGYVTYQWFGPNSSTNAIPAPNGINDTLTIVNGSNGDVYYLNAISANGCTTQAQAVLQVSTVGVSFTNSTPTCPGGNSGTASIVPTGSPGTYTYQWTNSSGTTVSTTNPATGLAPGTYTVHVASTGCGSHDTTVNVGIAPPITSTTTKNFCGSAAILTAPAGAMNIQWYNASGVAVAAPSGTNDSLLATNTSNGQIYSVVYSMGGCFDSLRITLTQVAGGTLSHSGIQNVCVGASNGQAQVVLTTTATPASYNYQMTGPGFSQTYTGVSTTSYTLTGLSYGNYTVTAFDGMCFYGDQFKIDTIPMPVYLTVAPKALCSSDSAYINYTFGGAPPTQCQLSSSTCLNPGNYYAGPANTANFNTSYPTPFGNWYTKMRAQYIYTAAELNAAGINAGKINSIQFNVTTIDPTAATIYPDFNIGIGCTSQSTFSVFPAQTDLIPGTVNVYSNAAYNVTLGLNTFNFTQAYDWDGISNIVIEVCFEFPGQVNYTYNCVVDNTTSTNYPSLTIVSDTDPLCAGLTTGAFYYTSSQQMRPTATFGWCSSVATPNMYTYSLNPNVGVLNAPINPPTTTIIQPPSTTSYTFTTTSLVGNCTKKDTFTIAIVAPFSINMPPPVSFCTNDNALGVNATFTDAGTGLPTTISSVWSGPGISSNNGVGTATFTPASASVGTHTLMVIAGGQCMIKDSVIYTVNLFLSGQISPIGPFCLYDAPVIIPQVAPGGTWTGPANASGLFTPSTAGVTSNLTPPYHLIKYVVNGGTPCADSSSIQVQVFNKPLVDFTSDTTQGCAPNVGIQFNSNVSPPGGTYHWIFNNGQTSTAASPQNVYSLAGTYSPRLTYIDPNGCRDSITKTGLIIVHASPNASFNMNPDHTTILEPHIVFTNTSTGGGTNTWFWNIADLKTATTKNTDYEFAEAGLYQVTLYVTNQFNCKDSVIDFIKVDPDNVLYVPSAFTPNSDGKNDIFMAEAFGVKPVEGFRMQLYDRWGGKLFESGDIYKGWDGTKGGEVVEEGLYIYSINYKDTTGKMHTKTGQVSLIK